MLRSSEIDIISLRNIFLLNYKKPRIDCYMMKSERLKKLEKELAELKKWFDLDLVPKKDLEKHSIEMDTLKGKIHEEKKAP